MRVNLAGKKQEEHHSRQTKPSLQQRPQFGGESEYYLDLENGDKK